MKLGPGEPPAGPWRTVPVAELVRVLRDAAEPLDRLLVVAVDGRSAGGKTTTAALLQAAVPRSAVVHTDDVAWYQSFFGWADLLRDGVLEPVRAGRGVRYRPPAWDERRRAGAIEVAASATMLVVEGVGAARRELVPYLDAIVWVQSDFAGAERRGIVRDGGTPAVIDFWHEWMAEEIPFLAEQRPWERADAVVLGTPSPRPDDGYVVVADPPRSTFDDRTTPTFGSPVGGP